MLDCFSRFVWARLYTSKMQENLGWVAEEWWGRGGDGGFNLEVLNMTGILSRPLLEQRMRLCLQ